jgi:aspartyl-tRNA(Asn)/glutamyl-tRNA(Gln) amidotransferase subunit C
MEIKDVENLALLARIELSDVEKQEILDQMSSILGYVNQIASVDPSGVDIDNKIVNVWREDENKEVDFSMDLIIDQFPASQNGFLKVKKIL